jgi:hypothetical protein
MTLNKLFIFILGVLVIINVTYFIKGVRLGDEISNYERELKVLEQQNADYEQEIYALESLSKTASVAAELKFGKYNDPIFTDMPRYALKN